MPVGAVIGGGLLAAGGAIGSAAISSHAAKSAAQTQANAGQQALNLQTQIYNRAQPMFAPYQQLGQQALGNLANTRPLVTSADPAILRQQNPTLQRPAMPNNPGAPINTAPIQLPQLGGPNAPTVQPTSSTSSLVMLRLPNGSTLQVPAGAVPQYQSQGAQVIG